MGTSAGEDLEELSRAWGQRALQNCKGSTPHEVCYKAL